MKWDRKTEENTREHQKKDPRKTCQTVQIIGESSRYKKRRTQANRLRGRRHGGWGRGAIVHREGETQTIGSEGAADRFGEHFSCSSVIPGGPEVQGLGKEPPGILTGRAVK